MIWTIFWINILTVVVSFKKRMVLYALLSTMFIYIVTGQAFQIEADLHSAGDAQYLHNYITPSGFNLALWYVLGISVVSLVLAIVSRGYRSRIRPAPRLFFRPRRSFYVFLFLYLCLISYVLIFIVIGLDMFLHSSRPGFQQGSTIMLALLSIGLVPLLLKLLYSSKVQLGDIVCFLVAFAVTGAIGRIEAIFYLVAVLLAFYYARGWADRPVTLKLAFRIFGFGALVFFIIAVVGSVRDAQSFMGGSFTFSDIGDFLKSHPEKSSFSMEFSYRYDIEGMSGISGAFTQYVRDPHSVHYDLGTSWIIKGIIQSWPGFLKIYAVPISDFSDSLNWHPDSVLATAAETYFMSFGWLGILLYPLTIYLFSWTLPLLLQRINVRPVLKISSYIFMSWTILFVRGSLPAWIAFSFSYCLIALVSWPIFRRYLLRAEPQVETINPN